MRILWFSLGIFQHDIKTWHNQKNQKNEVVCVCDVVWYLLYYYMKNEDRFSKCRSGRNVSDTNIHKTKLSSSSYSTYYRVSGDVGIKTSSYKIPFPLFFFIYNQNLYYVSSEFSNSSYSILTQKTRILNSLCFSFFYFGFFFLLVNEI